LVIEPMRGLVVALCLLAACGTAHAQPWELVADAEGPEFSIAPEGAAADGTATEVAAEARTILAQPDYRRMRVRQYEARDFDLPKWNWPPMPNWLKNIFRAIGRFFSGLAEFFGFAGGGLTIGGWLLLAAIVAVILYLILRVLAGYQARWAKATAKSIRKSVQEGEAGLTPGETSADEFLAKARAHAARGEFREAIGCLLMGGMSHAERAAWIRPRRGLTHRDYLKAMRSKPEPHAGFKTILGIYEPICFGRRDAFQDHFDLSLEHYERGFAELAKAKK
jgi:hypothetical protein